MHGLAKEFVQYVYITEPSTPSTTPVWEAKSSWDLMFCKGWLSFTKLFGCFQFKAFVYGSIFLSKNGKLVIFVFSEGPRRSFLSALGEGGKGYQSFSITSWHLAVLTKWVPFHLMYVMKDENSHAKKYPWNRRQVTAQKALDKSHRQERQKVEGTKPPWPLPLRGPRRTSYFLGFAKSDW